MAWKWVLQVSIIVPAPRKVNQPLSHTTEAAAVPGGSLRILFTQRGSALLPKIKYSFDARKILDEL